MSAIPQAPPAVPAPDPAFRALTARRGVEVVSRNGVVWANSKRPDYAHAIAVLLSECPRERLARLLAEGEKS
jgi:hypothetical protein